MADSTKARRSKKRRQIVEAGLELFGRFGVRRVSVEEICRTAGVSKMTFYKYYSNKMELVKSIWSGWADEGFRRFEEIDAMDIPFREKLRMIIDYKMTRLDEIGPMFLDEIIHGDPEMKQFIGRLQERSITRFMEYLRAAQERGEMSDIRPELFLALLEWMRGIVKSESLRALYPDDVAFIRDLHNFIFFGIIPNAEREVENI